MDNHYIYFINLNDTIVKFGRSSYIKNRLTTHHKNL